jgi:hypothetical protein
VFSCNLLKKLRLKSDIIHETAEAAIDVAAHVEHKQTLRVDFLDAISSPKTKLKHVSALVGKFRSPLGHLRESHFAAGLNHGALNGLTVFLQQAVPDQESPLLNVIS